MIVAAIATAPLMTPEDVFAQSGGSQSQSSRRGGGAEVSDEIVVTDKFIDTRARGAMKIDVPVRDIPMTSTNYSDAYLKALETSNVTNLYAYITGVKRAGNSGTDLTIRGFKSTADNLNTMLYDGLPGPMSAQVASPTIAADHIEVVKGPASVLYGQAQPGGFVNFVLKKPKRAFGGEVSVRASAYPGNDVQKGADLGVDVTGPLNSSATLFGRAVLSAQSNPSFRTGGWSRDKYAALSLTYEPSADTSLTLMTELRDINRLSDTGLVAPNKDINLVAPLHVRYNRPTDAVRGDGKSYVAIFNHLLDNGIKWDIRYRNASGHQYIKDWVVASAPGAGSFAIPMRARNLVDYFTYNFADTSLLIPLETGAVSHRILLGMNGGRSTADNDRLQFYTAPGVTLNAYSPNYSNLPDQDQLPAVLPTATASLTHRYSRSLAAGAYVSDLVTLGEHWKANVGLRWTKDKASLAELRVPNTPTNSKDISKVLPSAALMWQPTNEWTLYTSYSTSYTPPPANAVDINGVNSFRPVSAKQYEVGLKADLLGGDLTTTLALFNIIQKNVVSTFTANCPFGTCSQQTSGQSAKGGELEMNYKVFQGWQVTAGYAYTNSKITDALDPVQSDLRAVNAPLNDFHLWSRYDFLAGAFKGLGLGFGQVYVSKRTGTLPTTADRRMVTLPGYSTTDAAVYYVFDNYDLTLKLGNVFNRRYYESTGASGEINIFAGSPRMVSLSVRAFF